MLEDFDQADANKDGYLDSDEFKVYHKNLEERQAKDFGGAISYTE